MPYDHFLFEPQDLGDAIDQINEEHSEIVGCFYLTDSQQVCLIVRADNMNPDSALKKLLGREE